MHYPSAIVTCSMYPLKSAPQREPACKEKSSFVLPTDGSIAVTLIAVLKDLALKGSCRITGLANTGSRLA